jgi:hypothetical protein
MEEGSRRARVSRIGREAGTGSFVTMRLFGVSTRGTSRGSSEYLRECVFMPASG